ASDRHQGPSGFGRERGVVPQLRGGERRRRRPPLRQETARRDPRRREELPRLPGGGHFAQHGRGVHAASDAVEPATGVVPPSSAAFKPAGSRHYTYPFRMISFNISSCRLYAAYTPTRQCLKTTE